MKTPNQKVNLITTAAAAFKNTDVLEFEYEGRTLRIEDFAREKIPNLKYQQHKLIVKLTD